MNDKSQVIFSRKTSRNYRALAALTLSFSALSTLVYFELWPKEASAEATLVPTKPVNFERSQGSGKRSEPKKTSVVIPSAPPKKTVDSGKEPEKPQVLTMPDFAGMRLSRATKAAKAAGIRLVVRDEDGERIDFTDAFYYRIRRQAIKAGTTLQANPKVRVTVDSTGDFASGY